MKKLLFIMLSLVTFYSNAQEKILLTTGDSLSGIVYQVDETHTKIVKSDGTSVIILSETIKNQKEIDAIQSKKAGQNLIFAAEIIYTSFLIVVAGVLIGSAGILIAAPILAIIGGVVTIVGEIYSITAWKKIGKAGKFLKKNRL